MSIRTGHSVPLSAVFRRVIALAMFSCSVACAQPADPGKTDSARKAMRCDPEAVNLEPGKRGMDAPMTVRAPGKGEWFRDPAYGSCMVRVTDHRHEPPEGFARNDYSRRQPFNADGSRLLVYARDGYWHLYDARTLEYVRRLDLGGGSTEPHWHPDDPDLLFLLHNNGGMQLMLYNVTNDKRTVAADFGKRMPVAGHGKPRSVKDIWPSAARVWTRSEGSPSMDARYWAFQVETKDFKPLGLISYDAREGRITGVYDFAADGNGIGRPDHVSMSPKGNYVVASWNGGKADCSSRRKLGDLHEPCGLMAYTRDFHHATGLAARGPHSDMALDAHGREVIVISNYITGNVEMISLDDGDVTTLWRIYDGDYGTAMHVSGKAYGKPGWVLISTYATRGPDENIWFSNKLMAVELSRNPRIYNIANTFNRRTSYFSEPHAVVNRDFTKIIYNSNFGSGRDEDIDVYEILLPRDALKTQ